MHTYMPIIHNTHIYTCMQERDRYIQGQWWAALELRLRRWQWRRR